MTVETIELTIQHTDGNKVSIVISKTDIILNGVKYVPCIEQPNKLSIYLERDILSPIHIPGTNTKQIMTNIKKIKLANPDTELGTISLIKPNGKEHKRFDIDVRNLSDIEAILNTSEVSNLLHTNSAGT